MVGLQVKTGDHSRHGVDLAAKLRHKEAVHHARGGQLQTDRRADGNGQPIDACDALIGIDEQPFPVERRDLDSQRLHGGCDRFAPTHATPPTRNTVMAGIDQTSISRRPEYAKFGRYRARSFDARNQKATPSVARITGITIASMMPSALSRICRSARATGPFGSSTPSVQPPSVAAPIRTTASKPYRMLDLAEVDGAVCVAAGAG